jgi:hypothetical protein
MLALSRHGASGSFKTRDLRDADRSIDIRITPSGARSRPIGRDRRERPVSVRSGDWTPLSRASNLCDVDDRWALNVMLVHRNEMILVDVYPHLATLGQLDGLLTVASQRLANVHNAKMRIFKFALGAKAKVD